MGFCKGARGRGMRIATGALRPRNDGSRKNLRVIPRPVRRLVVGIRNTPAQRTRRTDCHTSDIGHWFAMTHYKKCGISPDGRTEASAPTGWLHLKTPPMPRGMRGEKIAVPLSFITQRGPFTQGRAEGICIPRAPGRTFRAASQGGLQPVTAPLLEKLWRVLFPINALCSLQSF